MKTLEASIRIDASADTVWEILTNFPAYRLWNPLIRRIEGELREGGTLAVTMRPPGHRTTVFHPRILQLVPGAKLRWRGRLLIPGLFDGDHVLTLRPAGRAVIFRQQEGFAGVLVPMLGGLLADTASGFREMNEALKARAEAGRSLPLPDQAVDT